MRKVCGKREFSSALRHKQHKGMEATANKQNVHSAETTVTVERLVQQVAAM